MMTKKGKAMGVDSRSRIFGGTEALLAFGIANLFAEVLWPTSGLAVAIGAISVGLLCGLIGLLFSSGTRPI